ncbi:MAG: hypothetical protein AMXMBFR13_36220 [Phycisphaerae bacterium]
MSGHPETVTVAAGQLVARLMNDAPATLASIEALINRAAAMRVELLVLPECAYPAYLLGSVTSYRAGDHLSGKQYVHWLQERAERHRLHIVSGFVEEADEVLHNSAVLIDDRGQEVGRSRKRFLWHADHEWFAPGNEIRAFDTRLGRVGMVICAETRVPEILATLTADGAELIALPTCWINHARESGRFENPQVEYLMEARAREFGVPFVCADKCGLELGAVGYVGQSRIIRADGTVAAEAPPTGETVIAARMPLRRPNRLWISERRREALLEADAAGEHPITPAGDERLIRVAAMPTVVANQRYTGSMGEGLFEPLRKRDVQLLLVNMGQEAPAEQLAMMARAFDMHAVGFPTEAGLFRLGAARVGCVAGQWVRSFAAARALSLAGAEILMLFDIPDDLPLLRTRALENRVFVMGVSERWAVIIAPDGTILGRSASSDPREVIAQIDLTDAANKQVAPKTDVFAERRVDLYRF